MRRTGVDRERISFEVTRSEAAGLLIALSIVLDGGEDLDPESRQSMSLLRGALVQALAAETEAAERYGPPFVSGEEVVFDFSAAGPVPGLRDGDSARVVEFHGEDELHDYEWCSVRIGDGREVDLPAMLMHRPHAR
jgi:hypothetical protein